jgi:hypothetical protein
VRISVQGEPRELAWAGRLRSFCAQCGTPLTFMTGLEADEVDVPGRTLPRHPEALGPGRTDFGDAERAMRRKRFTHAPLCSSDEDRPSQVRQGQENATSAPRSLLVQEHVDQTVTHHIFAGAGAFVGVAALISVGIHKDITQSGKTWDLSKIDFEKLKEDFKTATYKNIEITDLRAFIQQKLDQMLQQNATRADFAQRLQGIIDAYNAGSSSADNYFEELVKFTKDLKAESERHIREGLSEDELELFDLLKKDKMTIEETQKVKLAAKSLLHRLREEQPKVLVQDWFKDSQSRGRVRSAVEKVLHSHLPESYDRVIFTEKCNNVFDVMLNYASQGLKWAA